MKKDIFSIQIYKYKVQNWPDKKIKLLNLFDNQPNKIIGNVITSPIDIKADILFDEIKLFENDIKLNFNVGQVWFQRYKEKMNHAVHTHGPLGFSSVCFIEYNKSNHHPTTFVSPFLNNITGIHEQYQPDIDEGDIIFFPSNLMHYVPTNLTKVTRTIMSFNLHIANKTIINYN